MCKTVQKFLRDNCSQPYLARQFVARLGTSILLVSPLRQNSVDSPRNSRTPNVRIQLNWGKTNPSFFQVVTNLYIPEKTTSEDQSWFNDLQVVSVSPDNLVKTMRAAATSTSAHCSLPVSVLTIVFHAARDRIAPPEQGRIPAAEIPGAPFVPLPTANHILLSEEPAWRLFLEELASFFKCNNAQASAAI